MDQEKIIEGILSKSEHQFEKAVSHIYTSLEYAEPVKGFLRSKGLQGTDVETLWTDIVVQFASLVKKGKYKHEGKLLGFIKNLSGYMLLNYFRSNKKHAHVNELNTFDSPVEAIGEVTVFSKELKGLFDKALSIMSKDCYNILTLWSRGYNMEEIKSELKIISAAATRKRKHICWKKLLQYIQDDKQLMHELKQYL